MPCQSWKIGYVYMMPLSRWIFVISGLTTYGSVHMTQVVSCLIKTGMSWPLYGTRRLQHRCASVHPLKGFYVN